MWWQFTTFSLFPSAAPRLPPRYAPPLPLAARASAYALHLRTAAACLSRCIRHWRRSKAKPVRGRSSAAGGSLRFTSVSLPLQNVTARRSHHNYSLFTCKKSRAHFEHGIFICGKELIQRKKRSLRSCFQSRCSGLRQQPRCWASSSQHNP